MANISHPNDRFATNTMIAVGGTLVGLILLAVILPPQMCQIRPQFYYFMRDELRSQHEYLLGIETRMTKDQLNGLVSDYYKTTEPGPVSINPSLGVIYSYGPDEVDHMGKLEYDPTNGNLSSGDIIRSVDMEKVRFQPKWEYLFRDEREAFPLYRSQAEDLGMRYKHETDTIGVQDGLGEE